MGLFDFFRRKKDQPKSTVGVSATPAPKRAVLDQSKARVRIGKTLGNVEIAGENYHRSEIQALFESWGYLEGGVRFVEADLVPDPRNPHDRNAVKVLIDGFHVGFVPSDDTASIKRSIAHFGGNKINAYAPARIWASNDDGEWRGRVTLTFEGWDRPANRDFRRERLWTASRMVDGRDWTDWREDVAEMKRSNRLEEAKELLLKCAKAAEINAALGDERPNDWPTEHLSIVLTKLKDQEGNLAALERYASACGEKGVPEGIQKRLDKARAASGK